MGGENKRLSDKNRISINRPDLIKYFVNPEDAYKYSVNSHTYLDFKCPECGTIKNLMIKQLNRHGFSCGICNDGITLPEKFGINLLKQIGVEFETQKIFDWSNKKKYDFYIPSLNILMESHGEQHYFERKRFTRRSLDEEQQNDMHKLEMALLNNFEFDKYIVIDCRESTFEWMRNSYIEQLSKVFDLSHVDWDDIWIKCQSSLILEAWDLWNNKDDDATTVDIGKIIGVDRATIIKYLKIGTKLNKCKYDPKEEMRKSGLKKGKTGKAITQFSTSGEVIKTYKTIASASYETGILLSCISECCLGHIISSGGFIWRFAEDKFDKYTRVAKESGKKRIELDEVFMLLHELNYIPIDISEYVHTRIPIRCYDSEGYIVLPVISKIKSGRKNFDRIGTRNPNTIYNIKNYLKINNASICLQEGQAYESATKKLKFICNDCNEEFEKSWTQIKDNPTCNDCKGVV